MNSPFKTPFRYYLIRGNKLANHDVVNGEITGIVKIPHRFGVWRQSAIDGGDIDRITEPEYSTYEAFGITIYEWIVAADSLRDGGHYVYTYNPELYEVVDGKVEPKCTT